MEGVVDPRAGVVDFSVGVKQVGTFRLLLESFKKIVNQFFLLGAEVQNEDQPLALADLFQAELGGKRLPPG